MAKISRGRFLEELTWPEVAEAIGDSVPLVIVVGSVEQHGPHLPLCTDTTIPLELAKLVAEQKRILIAPPITYGAFSRPRTGGGQSFPGTTSLSGNLLFQLVKEVIGEFVRQGFRRFVVLNGHFENTAYITEGLETALTPASNKAKAVLINWWEIVSEQSLSTLFPGGFPGWEVEHAALTETSLMEFMRPEMVRMDKIRDDRAPRSPTYEIIPAPDDIKPKSGVLWKATLASHDNGRKMAEEITNEILSIMKIELDY